jgi:hypothetical protein
MGSRDMDPRVLILDTRWKRKVIIKPWPFYSQRKKPGYPLDRQNGIQSRYGRGGEEKIPQPLPGVEPQSFRL